MLLRLQPKRDERAALAFLDLASALDAGLPAATFGGDPKDGDDMVALALQRRGAALDPTDDIVLRALLAQRLDLCRFGICGEFVDGGWYSDGSVFHLLLPSGHNYQG